MRVSDIFVRVHVQYIHYLYNQLHKIEEKIYPFESHPCNTSKKFVSN